MVRDPDTVAFIEQELKRGIYRGIGEFHLDGVEADTPVIRRIVQIASERKLWMHAHSDAEAIDKLFAYDPHARIVWAHAGMSEPPGVIDRMLSRYPALWADLSYRDVAPGDTLDPEWKALFLKYPDRFLYGSDTWIPPRWEEVGSLTQQARGWLAQLPPEVAENIAWRNAERIFGQVEGEIAETRSRALNHGSTRRSTKGHVTDTESAEFAPVFGAFGARPADGRLCERVRAPLRVEDCSWH